MERALLGLVVALIAPQPGVYAQLALLGDLTGGSLAHGLRGGRRGDRGRRRRSAWCSTTRVAPSRG
ncbi:MAG: hypothetical protein R3F29_10445 [Planctomycetota bacterium]